MSGSSYSKTKKSAASIAALLAAFGLGFFINSLLTKQPAHRSTFLNTEFKPTDTLKLGAFSISLSVKDLAASKQFYEHLGFKVFGGGMDKKYLIMKNENTLVGLFQGMFEGNMLTFNPGWDANAQNVNKFNDIREIQQHLKKNKIKLSMEADSTTKGPASIMLADPDGNVILIDQHR